VQSQVSAATIAQAGRLRKGRRKVGWRDPTPPLIRGDASETENID